MAAGPFHGSPPTATARTVAHGRNPIEAGGDRARIPELDGVRGVAILCVLVYHALHRLPAVQWPERVIHKVASTGWVGVDLFFVLSGFLITGILIDAKGADGYFRRFYARRALRILPLYLAFVILIVELLPLIGVAPPADGAQLQRAAPWYWAHSVNLLIAFHGWKAAAWNTGHLWSLAVEEQFYLLWPAVVFMLSRRALTRTVLAVIAGAALLRVLLVALHAPAMAVYVLLPTRMDALAIGALLAVLVRDAVAWRQMTRYAIPAGVTMMLVVLGVAYIQRDLAADATLTQLVAFPSIAVVSAAVLITAVTAPAGSARALFWNQPILQVFGKYSYGLYVWHYPVVGLLQSRLLPDAGAGARSYLGLYALSLVATITLSLAVAVVSWRIIEQPALRLKRFVPQNGGRAIRRAGPPVLETDPA